MNIDHFKQKLEAEKKLLETELSTVGHKENGDWQPSPETVDTSATEPDELADREESFEANRGIESALEGRLAEVGAALARIEQGTYGVCEISGEPIEEERLEANPAARTCMAHTE